jgi:hypothetical protein
VTPRWEELPPTQRESLLLVLGRMLTGRIERDALPGKAVTNEQP